MYELVHVGIPMCSRRSLDLTLLVVLLDQKILPSRRVGRRCGRLLLLPLRSPLTMKSNNSFTTTMIGNGNHSYVAKWTCDVCKVQAFDTFEAAEAHEKNCTDQPPVMGVPPVPTQAAVSASVSAAEAANAAGATPIDLTELSDDNGGGSVRNET